MAIANVRRRCRRSNVGIRRRSSARATRRRKRLDTPACYCWPTKNTRTVAGTISKLPGFWGSTGIRSRRIRVQFVAEGEKAINRRQRERPPIEAKLDGKQEAQLVANCCSPPPEGRAVWTLSLLVDALKERGIVTEISRETVRKSLKKTSLSRRASNATVSPRQTEPGSFLNVLAAQCLDRRLPDATTMDRQLEAWSTARNATKSSVTWCFTTANARIKLRRQYPLCTTS